MSCHTQSSVYNYIHSVDLCTRQRLTCSSVQDSTPLHDYKIIMNNKQNTSLASGHAGKLIFAHSGVSSS